MKKTIKVCLFAFLTLFLFSGIFCQMGTSVEAAKATTTTKKTKKTKKKVYKLKKAVKKPKTTKKVSTKKSTGVSKSATYKITTQKTVKTTVLTKLQKKKKTVTTTILTTIKTTKEKCEVIGTKAIAENKINLVNGTISIDSVSSTVDPMIIKAFKEFGGRVSVNTKVSYAGRFSAKDMTITLRSGNRDYLLHELGHFAAFLAYNADKGSEFASIYNSEKGKYQGSNKSYVTADAAEYFAESFKEYYTGKSALKSQRPKTYAFIEKTINSIGVDNISYYKPFF